MAIATSSQTIGPFFTFGLHKPQWNDLTRDGAGGTPIRIEGTVYDGDRAAVPDALIELWQADGEGRYAARVHAVPPDRLFRGFGRASTDGEGRYWFRTVMPGQVKNAAGGPHAPHVDIVVFARGLLHHLITRAYFSDRATENAADPVLRGIADERARRTLIATRSGHDGGIPVYTFDIVLQGEGETAFFEI